MIEERILRVERQYALQDLRLIWLDPNGRLQTSDFSSRVQGAQCFLDRVRIGNDRGHDKIIEVVAGEGVQKQDGNIPRHDELIFRWWRHPRSEIKIKQ